MPPWIVYWTEAEVDGLGIRISGQPEDRSTRALRTADIHHLENGDWLATVFRLHLGESGACVYSNFRYRATLLPRKELLIKSTVQFQADIRAGEVNACIE